MEKNQSRFEGTVQKTYKTVDNKKLSTLWIVWNNIYNIIVIAMMISVTSGLYYAYLKFTTKFMWIIYILIGLTALYTLFYIFVLLYSHKEKDDDKAIRNVGYFRNIVNITKSLMSVFYVILTFVLLLDGWVTKIGLDEKWSYVVAAVMVGHSIISIFLQIYYFRLKMVRYKEKEEERQAMKRLHAELKEDIKDSETLLKHRKQDIERQKKSMMYKLWSMYQKRYVQPKKVEIGNVIQEEEKPTETVPEYEVIFENPVATTEENLVEKPHETDVNEIFNQQAEDDTETYFFDAKVEEEKDETLEEENDEPTISIADIVSDYSDVFDFPDGKTRSDD